MFSISMIYIYNIIVVVRFEKIHTFFLVFFLSSSSSSSSASCVRALLLLLLYVLLKIKFEI